MKQSARVIGICLIKNEDIHIKRILKNVVGFCDEIIVLDNLSTDKTHTTVAKLTQAHPNIRLQKIIDCKTSHSVISPYAGTNTWIFRIDGDEIYDAASLLLLRNNLLSGIYDKFWRIEGNSLNCTDIDFENTIAQGYLSPPSKPAPQLYNFSMLNSWVDTNAERLHGDNIVFKPGFDKDRRLLLFEQYSWEESPFRCLHICFMKRSSLDDERTARLNPNELATGFAMPLNFFRNLLKSKLSFESNYKLEKYKIGPLVSKHVPEFFPEN
jgi:glycosyltransferase involved in cell wall biosynthesis